LNYVRIQKESRIWKGFHWQNAQAVERKKILFIFHLPLNKQSGGGQHNPLRPQHLLVVCMLFSEVAIIVPWMSNFTGIIQSSGKVYFVFTDHTLCLFWQWNPASFSCHNWDVVAVLFLEKIWLKTFKLKFFDF
jgi:hypothetical protein